MKVLVTGANGYLGRGIVSNLLEAGHSVVAVCLSEKGNLDERADIIYGDIFEEKDPFNAYGKPDVLLHLAWKDGFLHYADSHMNMLPKHVDFIKRMAESAVKTIAVMGTMHEVGFYEGSIHEDTPCHPESYYGIAKNALRDYTRIVCKKNSKNYMWLRGYYIVGNTSDGSSVFSKIVSANERGESVFPFTMGLNQFDFLDYDVFCKYVSAAIAQDDVSGVINISSGRPEKLSDRVERFIDDNNLTIRLDYGAFPDRPYDSKAVWGDDKKIRKIMNAVHGE